MDSYDANVFLPIRAGGVISGILLIPALIGSVVITKAILFPLKKIFLKKKSKNDIDKKVLSRRCKLKCDLEYGRLGQAVIKQKGAAIVINATPEFEDESFKKNESAFVFRKDEAKNMYYIAKTILDDDMYEELEEL